MKIIYSASLFFLLLAACTPNTQSEQRADPISTSTAESSTPVSDDVTIYDSEGVQIALISRASGEMKISHKGKEYTRVTKGEKSKWYDDASDANLMSVKRKGDGFKLKTDSGTLRWKVKLYESKIKISDNEENLNPWQIKSREGNRAKLMFGENEIGQFTHEKGDNYQVTSAGKSYRVAAARSSLAWPVLLIDEIPQLEQCMIIAQLIESGK